MNSDFFLTKKHPEYRFVNGWFRSFVHRAIHFTTLKIIAPNNTLPLQLYLSILYFLIMKSCHWDLQKPAHMHQHLNLGWPGLLVPTRDMAQTQTERDHPLKHGHTLPSSSHSLPLLSSSHHSKSTETNGGCFLSLAWRGQKALWGFSGIIITSPLRPVKANKQTCTCNVE